jgi:bifunctional ADP-heptose synthase (sugar kinase/adenylyltransferase)
MTPSRLDHLLSRFSDHTIAVIGDFFLDKYLELDPALAETSLETGLTAHQVVGLRCQPGAAGTVVANLRALGVGRVLCLGFVGEDGEGHELLGGLRALGAETDGMLVQPDRFTPTYCKPLVREADGRLRELERFDTKNRAPLPQELELALIARLTRVAETAAAVIALDQVQEPECGVITTGMREALAYLASTHPETVWYGDSRMRVGEYRGLIVKSNLEEACRAAHPDSPPHSAEDIGPCASALAQRVGRAAFVTVGEAGLVYATPDSAQRVPAVPVAGEVDIVGAGDSATAGIVSALCSGADPLEAALIGNLVASLTIQQIGTTGTASQPQVRAQFARHAATWRGLP